MAPDRKISTTLTKSYDRLDRALLAEVVDPSEVSRSQLKKWIESGAVILNGKPCERPGAPVPAGAHLELHVPEKESVEIEPENIPLVVLFEDEHIAVINKQPDLVVHPGAGRSKGTLVHALAAHIAAGGMKEFPERMGIVHRLDKDTTGVMVVAKTARSHRALSDQFAARSVEKEYSALVYASPRSLTPIRTKDEGEIETLIGRHPSVRIRMAVLDEGGRLAQTRWRVVERFTYGALLRVRILTGRTHQIRVHLDHLGSPIVGDPLYGNFSSMPQVLARAAKDYGRQALHASRLALVHPATGESLQWEAPLPADFEKLLNVFRS